MNNKIEKQLTHEEERHESVFKIEQRPWGSAGILKAYPEDLIKELDYIADKAQ